MRGPAFIVREYAMLGNTLHTFVNAAALAAETNRVLVNLIFSPHAEYFAGTAPYRIACFPPDQRLLPELLARVLGADRLRRLLFSAKWRRRLAPCLFTLSASDDLEVRADFPALQQVAGDPRAFVVDAWNLHLPALVERHADRLRAFFGLSPAWQLRLDEWFSTAPRPAKLVGVHIRRFGLHYGPGEKFYKPDEFYRTRMREMAAALGPEVGFLICSDAPVDLACYAGLPVRLGPGHRILDLYALSRCDWIIGPCSTYSAWASWIGKVPRFEMLDDHPLELANFRVHQFE
jgi:hypothetical protein